MNLEDLKEKIARTIRDYNSKGWSPATSTNYSFLDLEGNIWVSRSGVDKSEFSANDFITVNFEGASTGRFSEIKPSAETLIHCKIYDLFPKTKVILHSHSVNPVVLSNFVGETVVFEGYEVQKGFEGRTTHEESVQVPVFENTQDMERLIAEMSKRKESLMNHCLLIRKHGTYAWGKNLFEAKRHLETLEYLCECELQSRRLNN